jgi:hypothetical protein
VLNTINQPNISKLKLMDLIFVPNTGMFKLTLI